MPDIDTEELRRQVVRAALAWAAVHDRPIHGAEGPEVGEYLAADEHLKDAIATLEASEADRG